MTATRVDRTKSAETGVLTVCVELYIDRSTVMTAYVDESLRKYAARATNPTNSAVKRTSIISHALGSDETLTKRSPLWNGALGTDHVMSGLRKFRSPSRRGANIYFDRASERRISRLIRSPFPFCKRRIEILNATSLRIRPWVFETILIQVYFRQKI